MYVYPYAEETLKAHDCELALVVVTISACFQLSWLTEGRIYTHFKRHNAEERILQAYDGNRVGGAMKFLYANSEHAIESGR